jgi:Arc/MetJ-type ribon-helix-helix transcriptional regulator
MKKQKQTVIPRKKPRPAATGKGEPVVVRMHPPQLKALDAWIAQQEPPFPSRPEAVRRLVELALANGKKQRARYSEKIAAKAMELASRAIDGLMDPSASADEKAVRKRRLFKGPSVFRDVRVDQPKKK